MVEVVSPSDIAPHLVAKAIAEDPDTADLYAPAEELEPEAWPQAEAPQAEAPQAEGAFEPEAPSSAWSEIPDRPLVDYPGTAGCRIYPLLHPVKFFGEPLLKQVTVHPPALWDIQDWAARRMVSNYELIARMVDMTPMRLGALRWPDINAIVELALPMLPVLLREAINMEPQGK